MAAKEIQPTRIMTSPDMAVNPRRARGTRVDLIFRRNDGWELGCPMRMVFWAHRSWADKWECVFVKVDQDNGLWVKYSITEWREKFFGSKPTLQCFE